MITVDRSMFTILLLIGAVFLTGYLSYKRKKNIVRVIFLAALCVIGYFFFEKAFLPMPLKTNLELIDIYFEAVPPSAVWKEIFVLPYNYFSYLSEGWDVFVLMNRSNIDYLVLSIAAGALVTVLFKPFRRILWGFIGILALVTVVWTTVAVLDIAVYKIAWKYININMPVFMSAGYLIGYGIGRLLIKFSPEFYKKLVESKAAQKEKIEGDLL